MQHLSIGAVSKLTQIPAHTLRKWESRHGIATPERTPTGRRVYTQEQVELLKLIKQLMASGHALSHLSGLGPAELQELAGMHIENTARLQADSLVLVGPNVGLRLTSQPAVRARFTGTVDEWLQGQPATGAADTVVIETDTIPPTLTDKLAEVRQQVTDLLVVYRFASSAALHALSAAQVRVVQGHVNDNDLLLNLSVDADSVDIQRPRQRFSMEELARIASLSPGLQCECPNHIATILMDISAFERYSSECVDSDPESAALHAELGAISARARGLFEDALVAVAAADGISLSVRD